MVDTTLNDLFGQRQVSTIYEQLNQYRVVMEAAPEFWQSPETLENVYVSTANGAQVPLSAFATYGPTQHAARRQPPGPVRRVDHLVQPGGRTSRCRRPRARSTRRWRASACRPRSAAASRARARAFQASLASQPWLILAALLTVYIVLGVLYESFVHPITILSTLPSAGVGALLALHAVRHRVLASSRSSA